MTSLPEKEFQKRKFAKELHDRMLLLHPEIKHENEWVTMVRVFHKVYDRTIRNSPTRLPLNELRLRIDLIIEEFDELCFAVRGTLGHDEGIIAEREAKDLDYTEVVDALGDLVYVILGFFLHMGVNPSDIMAEIQLSNMSKLGEDGKPIIRENGKILKGPNFFPPDFTRFIKDMK